MFFPLWWQYNTKEITAHNPNHFYEVFSHNFFHYVVSSWVKNSYYMSTSVQIFRISKIGMKQTYLILFLIIFNNLHSDWFMVTSSWNKILLSSDLSKWQFLSSNQLCCLHFTKSLHECIYWHASAFFDASS